MFKKDTDLLKASGLTGLDAVAQQALKLRKALHWTVSFAQGNVQASAICCMAAANCGLTLTFINSVRNYECFRHAVSKNVDAPDFNPFTDLPDAHIDADGLRRLAVANGVDDIGYPAFRNATIEQICQDYLADAIDMHRAVKTILPSVRIEGLPGMAILTGAAASGSVNRVRAGVANSNVSATIG